MLGEFDWQSFSTLATGFAAVIGASFVGMKQAGIAKRQADITDKQAEILDRQVELEEAKLRAELFEKRFQTYEATVDFVIHISQRPEDDPAAEERIQRFGRKMRESQFLFSDPKVYSTLLALWQKGNDARTDRAIAATLREDELPRDKEVNRRLLEYPVWAMETARDLPELFRHDLSIINEQQSPRRIA